MPEPVALTQTIIAVADFVVKHGTGVCRCLKRKYGYVKDMSKNFEKLRETYVELCAQETDVNNELDRNKREKEKTDSCKLWLEKVEKMKLEFEDVRKKYERTSKCLCGLCPFCFLVKLGSLIVKKTQEVVDLMKQRSQITIMREKPPSPHERMLANPITSEFPSVDEHVKKLQEHLRNENLKRICVWGPIQVGKSTIMRHLNDAIDESYNFDIVFWVTVNKDGNERDIQDKLLKRLKIKAADHSDEQKANMIHEELKNKSYLLLLDEVFLEIDLEKVGINDEHNGKVVFACRHRDDCCRADEEIEVKRLSVKDAENMFWKIVGVDLMGNPHIKDEAELIIRYCGGMPYLIKGIGNYLAKNARDLATNTTNPATWRDTLLQLTSPTKEPKQDLDKVYKYLKLEVDKLESDEKSCFLYLANFPGGHELDRDYIIECWRAEQFLDFEKLGQARDRGHVIWHAFVNKSLLEKGIKVARYKMFEFYQRVAFRFVKHRENNYILDREMDRNIKWEDATRISAIGNSSPYSLPKEPNCGRILTLLLQKSGLAKFSESFFEHMATLQLLDLYKTKIESLPPSISSLKNLKALFLNDCDQLRELPVQVGDLRSLEILDTYNSGIYNLPTEIGKLTDLKCLRVSFIKNNGNHNHVEGGPKGLFSSNIIAGLCSLEELSIFVDPPNGIWNQNVESIAAEVAALKKLTALRFYFPTTECVKTFISSSKSLKDSNGRIGKRLRSFNILVGYHPGNSLTEFDISSCSAEKRLRFCAGEGFPDGILKILKQACSFELIGHKASANLSVFSADILKGIEACIIEECCDMTSIIDGDCAGGDSFQRLNKLHINSLPKLLHIWKGSIQSQSLIMLTTLTLRGCHSLEVLFSQEMVQQLNKLQYLQIEDCKVIEEIIKNGSRVESGAFPELKNLELVRLPKLSTICNDVALTWNSLKTLKIEDCPVIEEITKDDSTVESKAFPKLKNLELMHLPKLSKICKNDSLKWDSLETLKIDTCMELKNFPSTFRGAKKLIVIHCTPALWTQLNWPDDNKATEDRFQNLFQPI